MGRRTLVVTSTFPQFEGDVRGAFLRHHWTGASRAGEEVHVLAPRTRWTEGSLTLPFEVRRFRYAPRRLSSLTGHNGILENLRERPWRWLLVPGMWFALERAIARELERASYDRVVAHFWLPAGVSVARLCRGRLPFELYGHGTDVDLLLRAPSEVRRRLGELLREAETLYVPSSRKRRRVLEAFDWRDGDARVMVENMGHAVAVEACEAPPVVAGPYLLFLGRLIAQKGVDDLLRAAARVPGCVVVIAGDGPERAALESLARRRQVDARFLGWVEGTRKACLLRDARALVVPSREVGGLREGSPLVVAEAASLGRPVVATDVGGIAELGRSVGAELALVPPGDEAALVDALRAAWAEGTGSVRPAGWSRSA